MAGIYIHIPFCKQACHYCNFHFSTTFESYRIPLIKSLQKEIIQRKDFFGSTPTDINSVYFGGGTPSLLQPSELDELISIIWKHFSIKTDAEVTLEANPDDLDTEYLSFLRNTPVNRLSIGIQSLQDDDLRYLNRSHGRIQAMEALHNAVRAGFNSISADLIFGIPTSGRDRLENDIRIFADLGIEHISAYGLTIEPSTALEKMIQLNKRQPLNEIEMASEMEWLMDFLPSLGFQQYEISNYALPGAEARHNSSYWEGEPYLGIGPSAHSYLHPVRSWNVGNNMAYIKGISAGESVAGMETLTTADSFNEYIMTGLRTRRGIELPVITSRFGYDYANHFLVNAQPFMEECLLQTDGTKYTLTRSGKLLCDHISEHLFITT